MLLHNIQSKQNFLQGLLVFFPPTQAKALFHPHMMNSNGNNFSPPLPPNLPHNFSFSTQSFVVWRAWVGIMSLAMRHVFLGSFSFYIFLFYHFLQTFLCVCVFFWQEEELCGKKLWPKWKAMCETIFGSVDSREGVLRLNGLFKIKTQLKKSIWIFWTNLYKFSF